MKKRSDMRSLLILAGAAGLLSTLAACAPEPGTPAAEALAIKMRHEARVETVEETIDSTPSWFLTPPKDDTAMYGAGTSTSSDMQLAIDKAVLIAKREVADRLKSAVSAKMKLFMTESGLSETAMAGNNSEFTTLNTITEVAMGGFERKDLKLMRQGEMFRAYALIRYPVGEANRVLVEQIKKDSVLEVKLRASKAFQELEHDIAEAKAARAKVETKPLN